MTKHKYFRDVCLASGTALLALGAATGAQAGGFAVREQSAYFQGSSFAGDAAGGDISSMFWNSAATATLPGFNTSSNYTAAFGSADLTADSGLFVTGLTPNTAEIGTDAVIPASYATYQLSDRLFAGLALNSPFGFITKSDQSWAGSPIATTSKVFSVDINPTLAYKLTPEISIGVGAQIEYFKLRIDHASFAPLGFPLTGARAFNADDWGVGATAGVLWQPREGTSIGLGYRSAVGVDVSGDYKRTAGFLTGPGFSTTASGSITLPDEVTLSARQRVTQQLALLGTVEWSNWSRVQNVTAVANGTGVETLNLNYRDGWLFSVGAEYAYTPWLTFRTGVGFERSPIQDSTRDILLPDADRIHLSFGASYKYSDRITVDLGYSHLFVDSAPFCIANPAANGGTSHCNASTPGAAVLLKGNSDNAYDLVSVGLKYRVSGPREELEPYK